MQPIRLSRLSTKLWLLFSSVIQFCSKAFALYAQATAVQEIFGPTLESLRGIKYLFKYAWTTCKFSFLKCIWWYFVTAIYHIIVSTSLLSWYFTSDFENIQEIWQTKVMCRYNVFQYAFLVCAGLASVYYLVFVSHISLTHFKSS